MPHLITKSSPSCPQNYCECQGGMVDEHFLQKLSQAWCEPSHGISTNSEGVKGEALAPQNKKALGRWSSPAMAGNSSRRWKLWSQTRADDILLALAGKASGDGKLKILNLYTDVRTKSTKVIRTQLLWRG
jgi:hypothetical protein